MRRSYLAGLFSLAGLLALPIASRDLLAQDITGDAKSARSGDVSGVFQKDCYVGLRLSVSPSFDLVNKAGDVNTYRDKGSAAYTDETTIAVRDDYSFGRKAVEMNRRGSDRSLSLGCSLTAATGWEVRFSRGVSRGDLSGLITQGKANEMQWWTPTWRSHLTPLFNTENCFDDDGVVQPDNFCVGNIPYWSSDSYNDWSLDLLYRFAAWEKNGLAVNAAIGPTYERSRYVFVTGQNQFAHYVIECENCYIPGLVPVGAYRYTFDNTVWLETTSKSTRHAGGLTAGLAVDKSVGSLTLSAEVDHAWLKEWGNDKVFFGDTDTIEERLYKQGTGEEVIAINTLYNGRIDLADTRNGYGSRTRAGLNAGWRLRKSLELQGGFSLTRRSGYLAQQITDPWALSGGGNKAPRGMELEYMPNKGQNATGFGVSGWWVGTKLGLW
jgi:hypothetical protein